MGTQLPLMLDNQEMCVIPFSIAIETFDKPVINNVQEQEMK
jgi:hypothetical protein